MSIQSYLKSLFVDVPRRLGYSKIVPCSITRDDFFAHYFSLKQHPFVLQLGANDGKTYDPLYAHMSTHAVTGLLVEPLHDVFLRLQSNYQHNPNIQCANVAIEENDGDVTFYRIRPDLVLPGNEYKASSGSSFYRTDVIENVKNRLPPKRKNVLKYISNDPNEYIEEVRVKALTLATLCKQYAVGQIDFVLIDCQGFDYQILKQFDFTKFSPDIINYEHCLLNASDLKKSRELLVQNGYQYFVHGGDTCAYKLRTVA